MCVCVYVKRMKKGILSKVNGDVFCKEPEHSSASEIMVEAFLCQYRNVRCFTNATSFLVMFYEFQSKTKKKQKYVPISVGKIPFMDRYICFAQ